VDTCDLLQRDSTGSYPKRVPKTLALVEDGRGRGRGGDDQLGQPRGGGTDAGGWMARSSDHVGHVHPGTTLLRTGDGGLDKRHRMARRCGPPKKLAGPPPPTIPTRSLRRRIASPPEDARPRGLIRLAPGTAFRRWSVRTQNPICCRPSSVRSSSVARPWKSTSKSIAAKSGAERPARNAAFCFGR
jgi:hypothetical protein